MLKNIFICVLLIVVLNACHSVPVINVLPELKHTLSMQIIDVNGNNSLLLIEPLGRQQWRFVQVDSLGAPISRQILQNGKWRNDGFMPPNPSARQLFSAVYAYLGQQHHWPIPSVLNDVKIVTGKGDTVADISWKNQHWQIRELADE